MKKLLFLLPLFLSLSAFSQETEDRGYIVKVGDPAPSMDLTLADGRVIKASDLKGKNYMLQFTASWCGVCRKEMPHIEAEIWKPYKDKGLLVFGVDRGEPVEKVKAFAETMKVTYPLALDEDESIFRKFALPNAGVTRNVLVDKDGQIVFLTRLYDEAEFNALKNKIAELMK